MGEDCQGLAVRERGRRGEDRVESRVACSCGDRLRGRVVVSDEVGLVHADVGAHGLFGQIEHLEDDVHATDATSELERVDAVVDEVTEQLGPGRLLLTRRVPGSPVRWYRPGARAGSAQEVSGCRVEPWCQK